MIGASVAAVALALIPPPIAIFHGPDYPERTTIDMRNDRPIHRCSFKGCPVLGHWPPGGTCPAHTGMTGPVVATPEIIAAIDALYDGHDR